MVATPDAPTSVPRRTCVGCRTTRPQRELVRCVLGPDGPAVSRTAPGRGAWVCSEDCLITAGRRKAFDRAWRSTVSTEAVAALRNVFRTVIINMEQLPDAGSVPCGTAPRKG